ncbi:MAG: hypothetical protein ABSH32_04565 [Bryobacteraceae bacterium]
MDVLNAGVDLGIGYAELTRQPVQQSLINLRHALLLRLLLAQILSTVVRGHIYMVLGHP